MDQSKYEIKDINTGKIITEAKVSTEVATFKEAIVISTRYSMAWCKGVLFVHGSPRLCFDDAPILPKNAPPTTLPN